MKEILVGLEIELLTYKTKADVKALDVHDKKSREGELRTFQKILQDVFSGSHYTFKIARFGPTNYVKNVCYLTDDWSAGYLKSTAKYFKDHKKTDIKGIYSVELLSPIMPLTEALDFYKQVCEKLFATGICHMNRSCGLHVNVSHQRRQDNINLNLTKVLSTFNIHKWRQAFNRENNTYCRTMPFNRKVLNEALAAKSNVEQVLSSDFIKKSDFRKYSAIAVHNWEFGRRKSSRIEWRMAGGVKAMDHKLVEKMIKDIVKSMQIGLSNRKITKRDIKVNLLGIK